MRPRPMPARRAIVNLIFALSMIAAACIVHPARAAFNTVTIDANAADFSSVALSANGFPVISYHDTADDALRIAFCVDPTCSADPIRRTLATNGNGRASSLAINRDGDPVISYYSSILQAVMIATCIDPTCASGAAIAILDSVGAAGGFPTALRLSSDDRPVVSYTSMAFNAEGARLAICGDAACSAVTIRAIDTREIGTRTALALTADDRPIVSYYHTYHLKLAYCADVTCTGTTITTVDDAPGAGTLSALRLDPSGAPVIAYYDGGTLDLRLARCGSSPYCTAPTRITLDATGYVGSWPSLWLRADRPVVSYYDETHTNLKLARCDDPACSTWALTTVDSTGAVGAYTALVQDAVGSTFISYADQTNGALRLAVEYIPPPTVTPSVTPSDTPTATITLSPTSTTTPTFTATEALTTSPTPSRTASPTVSPTVSRTASRTASPTASLTTTPTGTPRPRQPDTIGVYRPSAGTFYLRLSNTTGPANLAVAFGNGATDYPVVGDWDGDGIDTIGVYNRAVGTFSLRNSNTAGPAAITLTLGNPGDQPIAGRWARTANHDGAGVYRPSNGVLYLKNDLASGYADYFAILGNPSDIGIAGDWDGDGLDSPGVYRPAGAHFYLSDNAAPSGIVYSDRDLTLGNPGTDVPVCGDWDADGHTGVGVFRTAAGVVYLRNTLTTGAAEVSLIYGIAGDIPIAGRWAGASGAAPAVLEPARTHVPAQAGFE